MRITFTERHIYLLKKILQDDWNYSELREFFDYIKAISVVYLKACQKNNLRVDGPFETIEDIADDFMIDLFARDKNGFRHWQRYVEQNGFPNIETVSEFFYSIIKKKSRQGLDRLFYERDRQGWNNARMLTRFKDSYSYKVKRNGGSKFLVHRDDAEKQIMPESDFAKIYELYLRCADAPTMSAIAEKMLESIEENEIYARVISVGMLNKAIKLERKWALKYANTLEYKRNGYVVSSQGVYDKENDVALKRYIRKIVDEYCQDYRNNRPWGMHDYWKLAPVVIDYFNNFLDGRYESMYDTWCRHYPEMDIGEFHRTHKQQIDYLFKIVKVSVRKFLFGKCKNAKAPRVIF